MFTVVMEGPPIGGTPDAPTMNVLASDAEGAAARARAHFDQTFRVVSVHDRGLPRSPREIVEVTQEIGGLTMVSLRAEPWPETGSTTTVVADNLDADDGPRITWPSPTSGAGIEAALALVESLEAIIAACQERVSGRGRGG